MWIPKKSRSSGKTYYYNTVTKQTSWTVPKDELLKQDDKKEAKASSTVAKAYSTVAQTSGKKSRGVTRQIRFWNNLVKRHLIFNSIPSIQHIKALDLCCGRGGDMGKILQHPNVRRYRGVDISDGAVKEAINRSTVHNRYNAALDFVVADARTSSLETWTSYSAIEKTWTLGQPAYQDILMLGEAYDASSHHYTLINCQYALHYMCKTKKSLRDFLTRVRQSMNPTSPFACFIGTLPSAENIVRAIANQYPLPDYCKVTPGKRWKGNKRFGDPYFFYLEGGVPDLEEYLVPKDAFLALAKECGLKNTLYMNAGEYLERETKRRVASETDDSPWVNCTGSKMTDCQRSAGNLDWNVTCLYDVFVFVKK